MKASQGGHSLLVGQISLTFLQFLMLHLIVMVIVIPRVGERWTLDPGLSLHCTPGTEQYEGGQV